MATAKIDVEWMQESLAHHEQMNVIKADLLAKWPDLTFDYFGNRFEVALKPRRNKIWAKIEKSEDHGWTCSIGVEGWRIALAIGGTAVQAFERAIMRKDQMLNDLSVFSLNKGDE